MAKTRRVRKARKSTRKNKVYRGGDPLEEAYKNYVGLYAVWSGNKTNKTKFDAVYTSLNNLIDDMKSPRLKELERTKMYLDGLATDWPSAVEIFKASNRAALLMHAP
jgi:hypothetical protein